MKINLDPKHTQDFFLRHVEKFVFGLVVLGFIWFAQYTFFQQEGIAHTPGELLRITDDAEKRIKKPPEKLPVEAKDYEGLIKKTMDSIDPKDYVHRVLWCPRVFDPPPKRGEPRLLTVRDLRASAGCGKVYVAPQTPTPTTSPDEMMQPEGAPLMGPVSGMARETTKGERWVVLTGLVPYKEQIEAYIEAFRAASRESALTGAQPGAAPAGIPGAIPAPQPGLMEGPVPGMMGPAGSPTGAGADMPVYFHYHVQRVEVNSPGDSIEEADWEAGSINIRKAKEEATQHWTASPTISQPTEIGIPPLFWDQVLDFPLPRFADGQQLDESFAHPPEIPLLKRRTYQIGPDGRPIPTHTTSTEAAEPPPTEKPAGSKPDVKDMPDMPGVPGVGPGAMPPGLVPGAMPPGMEGMGPMAPMPGGAPGSFYGTMRLPDYKLFRFLDRTVEPGKRYRYRVRLWLVNPNYKQNPRLLERPELGKDAYLATPWSAPSNLVEVPRDDRLLVLGVKLTGGVPEGKVALLKWIHQEGELATKEEEKVLRGQVLNLPKQKWPEEDARKTSPASKPSTKQQPGMGPLMEDYELLMGVAGQKSKKTSKEKEKPSLIPTEIPGQGFGPQPKEPLEIDYLTECLVVDLRGGYRIDLRGQGRTSHSDPAYNAPGEMLLLHPEGYLYVQSELEDADQYEKILQMRAPKYDERFGPGMGMPPGMLEGVMPPPGGVPGELTAPGEKGRPKPSSKTTPKGAVPPRS